MIKTGNNNKQILKIKYSHLRTTFLWKVLLIWNIFLPTGLDDCFYFNISVSLKICTIIFGKQKLHR